MKRFFRIELRSWRTLDRGVLALVPLQVKLDKASFRYNAIRHPRVSQLMECTAGHLIKARTFAAHTSQRAPDSSYGHDLLGTVELMKWKGFNGSDDCVGAFLSDKAPVPMEARERHSFGKISDRNCVLCSCLDHGCQCLSLSLDLQFAYVNRLLERGASLPLTDSESADDCANRAYCLNPRGPIRRAPGWEGYESCQYRTQTEACRNKDCAAPSHKHFETPHFFEEAS